MITIGIPTMLDNVDQLITEIKVNTEIPIEIIATCKNQSASKNRNEIIEKAKYDIGVMVDDDVTKFKKGWLTELVKPFENQNVIMISARLYNPDGSLGYMINYGQRLQDQTNIEMTEKEFPFACIAYRKKIFDEIRDSDLFPDNHPFDENYPYGSYEDTDVCRCIEGLYPEGKFILNNNVKVIHANAEKWRHGDTWKVNQRYFADKWRGK